MAEKRMLSRRAAGSRKVTSLSVRAAFLWALSIPFFDRDGYLEAEADFLKDNIVRRRDDFPESDIPALVDEIVNSKLWISYRDPEGKRVVKDPKFKEFQKIEYKKEGPSLWEGIKLSPDNSPSTRRVVAEDSPGDKNRREKSSEEESSEERQQPPPVDNFGPPPLSESQANPQEEKDQQVRTKKLTGLKMKIWRKWPKFNFDLFVGGNLASKNPDSICEALEYTLEHSDGSHPMRYAQERLEHTSPKFNEAENTAAAGKLKADFKLIVEGLKKLDFSRLPKTPEGTPPHE